MGFKKLKEKTKILGNIFWSKRRNLINGKKSFQQVKIKDKSFASNLTKYLKNRNFPPLFI